MQMIPPPPILFHQHITAPQRMVSFGFWSAFALTLETMVQPSGRSLTLLIGCVCVGGGLVQGDTAEMPQAGTG